MQAPSADGDTDTTSTEEQRRRSAPAFAGQIIKATFGVFIFLGIASIVLGLSLGSNTGQRFTIIVAAAVIAFASACLGGLAGFIFAIPRAREKDGTQFSYLANTNLEQISDWLTKILVGISLIQIGRLQSVLGNLGRNLAPMLGGTSVSGGIGVTMCIAAALPAFILTYLWTSVAVTWEFENLRHAIQKIVEPVVERQLKQIVEEKVEPAVEDKVKQIVEDKASNDADALELIQQQLFGSAEITVAAMTESFRNGQKTIPIDAYSQAERQRERTWIDGPRDEHDRVITVFRALIDYDTERTNHKYYASLGYALKNKVVPDLPGAIDALSSAIMIRGANNGFVIYEYVRAVCAIRLNGSNTTDYAMVVADLRASAGLGREHFMDKEPANKDIPHKDVRSVALWLEKHNLTYDDLIT
jgi:hypothetical protein